MWEVFLALVVFGLLFYLSSNKEKVVIKTKVGDITQKDFNEELEKRYGELVLKEIVLIKLLEEKYTVSDLELNKSIENPKNKNISHDEIYLKILIDKFIKDNKSNIRNLDNLTKELAKEFEVEIKDMEYRNII